MAGSMPATRLSTIEFFKRSVIFVVVALTPLLVWFLFDIILITLGAVLIAVLLWLVSEPFVRWCRCPRELALLISGLLIIGVFISAAYLFGTRIESEFKDVLDLSGSAASAMMKRVQSSQFGKIFLSHVQGAGSVSIPAIVGELFTVSASFLGAFIVTIIAGFYLAAQPDIYRDGLSKLFPPEWRAEVDETLDDAGAALRLWLLGNLIEMALIGVLSTFAVWLIGLRSPFALGVIAGICEFVPYVGPLVAAIPALLVAATQGFEPVVWTFIAYLVIHQLEGNLIAPIIQQRMVFIPPAVMLLSVATILFVFGGAAVIFAAPIAVLVFVIVSKLYVRDRLGEDVTLPGEEAPSAE